LGKQILPSSFRERMMIQLSVPTLNKPGDCNVFV
jgi:hypothetical protein